MGAFLALVGLTACLCVQSDDFPDTPKNHWAYEAMADLQSSGFVFNYKDYLGRGPHSVGRFEIAVHTNEAYTKLHGLALSGYETIEAQSKFNIPSKVTVDLNSKYRRLRSALDRHEKELVSLIVEFTPELKALGVEVDGLAGQVKRDAYAIRSMSPLEAGEALQQFPDVPADHWAADAVKNLRSVGILHGYPDGKYRG